MKNGKNNFLSRVGGKIAAFADRVFLATPLVGDIIRWNRMINKRFEHQDFKVMREYFEGKKTFEDIVGKGNVGRGAPPPCHRSPWWFWW